MFAALRILIVYSVLALPAAVVGFPWTFLRGDIGLMYRWAMWIVRVGLKAGGVRVSVSGLENVPAGRTCIFMANHVSALDPPALFPLVPFRSAFFVKRELLRIPLFGAAIKWGKFIPVERDGRPESARASVEFAKRVLASGVHVVTFPEGTRSRTGRMQRFKKGPFYLASESGAPVIPVSICGTETMMAKGSLRVLPGTAHIRFHPVIESAQWQNRDELMAAVRLAIASGLPEWMRSGSEPAPVRMESPRSK